MLVMAIFLLVARVGGHVRQQRAHRVLKVARTLADLEDASSIDRAHLAEALQYRASGLA